MFKVFIYKKRYRNCTCRRPSSSVWFGDELCFTVGLLNALYALKGQTVTKKQLRMSQFLLNKIRLKKM